MERSRQLSGPGGTGEVLQKHSSATLLIAECCVKSIQPCPMLGGSVDGSRAGSYLDGILQVRILERVAMPSSEGSS